MKLTKTIYIVSAVVFLLAACQSRLWADAGPASNTIRRDPNMTKCGPRLSKEEVARIAKLSTSELADMLKNGETRHAYVALHRLIAGEGWKKNFDLLLDIAAETRGDMIVEGLVGPIKPSDPNEYKRNVDKFLDFLESQLKKDKPSVSRRQAVRSIAKTVYLAAAIRPAWRPYRPSRLKDPNDLLKCPYGNERVVNILIRCLENKDWRVRSEAILWLGVVGANDFTKANDVVATLEAQLAKEEARQEEKKVKARMKKHIRGSLRRLNREINYLRCGLAPLRSRPSPGPTQDSNKAATE